MVFRLNGFQSAGIVSPNPKHTEENLRDMFFYRKSRYLNLFTVDTIEKMPYVLLRNSHQTESTLERITASETFFNVFLGSQQQCFIIRVVHFNTFIKKLCS